MKHVTWPTLKQTTVFTTVIIIFTIIFAYFISAVDLGFIEGLGGLRRWLGDGPALVTQPQIQGGTILDSEGNEIQIENINIGDSSNNNVEVTPITE